MTAIPSRSALPLGLLHSFPLWLAAQRRQADAGLHTRAPACAGNRCAAVKPTAEFHRHIPSRDSLDGSARVLVDANHPKWQGLAREIFGDKLVRQQCITDKDGARRLAQQCTALGERPETLQPAGKAKVRAQGAPTVQGDVQTCVAFLFLDGLQPQAAGFLETGGG